MNIDYNLAKKLKDVGFPQNLDGNKQMNGQPLMYRTSEGNFYVPILSELIAECGDNIDTLARSLNGKRLNYWFAVARSNATGFSSGSTLAQGKTPEIAIANLYIKLHE